MAAQGNAAVAAQPADPASLGEQVDVFSLACYGEVDSLRAMLDAAPDAAALVNARDAFGHSPLHEACRVGHARAAELLLARGANVNARSRTGQTALHLVGGAGASECVAILVAAGVDIDARDEWDRTAAQWAFLHGHARTVDALIKAGADPSLEMRPARAEWRPTAPKLPADAPTPWSSLPPSSSAFPSGEQSARTDAASRLPSDHLGAPRGLRAGNPAHASAVPLPSASSAAAAVSASEDVLSWTQWRPGLVSLIGEERRASRGAADAIGAPLEPPSAAQALGLAPRPPVPIELLEAAVRAADAARLEREASGRRGRGREARDRGKDDVDEDGDEEEEEEEEEDGEEDDADDEEHDDATV
jgi:hypothetical protein